MERVGNTLGMLTKPSCKLAFLHKNKSTRADESHRWLPHRAEELMHPVEVLLTVHPMLQ